MRNPKSAKKKRAAKSPFDTQNSVPANFKTGGTVPSIGGSQFPVGMGSPNQGRWAGQANGSGYGIGLGGKDGTGDPSSQNMSFQKSLARKSKVKNSKKKHAKKMPPKPAGAAPFKRYQRDSDDIVKEARKGRKAKKQSKKYAHKGHTHKSNKAMKAC